MSEHTHFVPNGDSRKNTAILLVGTADEYGIGQESIRAVGAGFYITEELASIISEDTAEAEPKADSKSDTKSTAKKAASKKTSGNRAAKKNS